MSGKGVGAALLMATSRLAADAAVLGRTVAITDVIATSPRTRRPDLRDDVPRHSRSQNRVLRYERRPHPQFALGAKGTLERLGATGLPIGLLSGRGYLERTVQLSAGDLIALSPMAWSNGELEDMFSAGVSSLLSSLAGRTSGEVLRDVEKELKAFRGTREPYDDATLMAVSVG